MTTRLFSADPEQMRGNIENLIGAAQVPVGVAGPLLVHGEEADGLFYMPMATTEGALIRSYERGAVALTHAGGVQTALQHDENHTVPSFAFEDVAAAKAFAAWLPHRVAELQAETRESTSHGALTSLACRQSGRRVLVDFGFSTGDAQGMNMIVKATDRLCRWICDRYPGADYLLFSGMCSEKRPSGALFTRGKGKWVSAGAYLPDRILRLYLHASAGDLLDLWRTTVVGHLQAGTMGYNAHAANGLTAIFIATGQDVANVANAACVVTSFEPAPGGLYASITLPALTIATVGGGTSLATQREALEVLGCYGAGKAHKFAEIIAATILGGEISMAAALASGEFVAAHEQYGRNRPA
ncbi:MAG: hydroxymethylglutaryl-CoA reductase [Bryobacterales bacterium]